MRNVDILGLGVLGLGVLKLGVLELSVLERLRNMGLRRHYRL